MLQGQRGILVIHIPPNPSNLSGVRGEALKLTASEAIFPVLDGGDTLAYKYSLTVLL